MRDEPFPGAAVALGAVDYRANPAVQPIARPKPAVPALPESEVQWGPWATVSEWFRAHELTIDMVLFALALPIGMLAILTSFVTRAAAKFMSMGR